MDKLTETYDQNPADKYAGPTVLIVDNEDVVRQAHRMAIKAIQRDRGVHILEAGSIRAALDLLARQRVHVILLDKDLGIDETGAQQNGIESIPRFLDLQPHIQILVVTGSDAEADQIDAINRGAMGFVTKGSPELLVTQIHRAMEYAEKRFRSMVVERVGVQRSGPARRLGGVSLSWRKAISLSEAFAKSDAPVLITGPSGSGKSELAKLIHETRKRYLREKHKEFIPVNMGALNPGVAESELFGAERGAFTDAKEAKIGLFELANHGTLFLDEIGNASLDLQQKILTAIGDKTFYRVGSRDKKQIHSNFKLICATNEDLKARVAEGRFREDLFMRISVLEIPLDPLSKRREDIPDIVSVLLPEICRSNHVPELSFEELPQDLMRHLQSMPLPGNVRSIDHVLSRLIALCSVSSDEVDRKSLKNWREVLNKTGSGQDAGGDGTGSGTGPITFEELDSREFNLMGERFPGMYETIDLFTRKLFDEARRKHGTNNAIARALGISKSSASAYFTKSENMPRSKRRKATR